MTRKYLGSFALSFLLSGLVTVAAADVTVPQGANGIMFNTKLGQCANYWSGDSCTSSKAPEGWEFLIPQWSDKDQHPILTYQDKKCVWTGINQSECCVQFGFKYQADIKVTLTKTGREKDPKSECYQLPFNK